MAHKNRLICVTGPTASGKTALSVALAKARKTEIISADSMQLYRGMDVGTAKPTMAERGGVPHHLLDICEPEEPFSVARFVALADACAQALLAEGKIPVVCGGTALYMDALIECSTFSGDETDPALRRELNDLAAARGAQYVHDLLRAVDPEGAQRLHPNNVKRVVRALEVYRQTGMTLAEMNARNKRAAPKYEAFLIGLCPSSRDALYQRIDARVDGMFSCGLLEEARALYDTNKLAGTAGQAIGYKELTDFFRGRKTLEECTAQLKQSTRNYAKRQLTWLRRDARVHWIIYDENTDFSEVLQNSTDYLAMQGV